MSQYIVPAVSHIYILTDLLFNSKVRILKSTPIVGKKLSLKILSENLNKMEDLPTELFPINNNLNKKS